MSQHCVNSEVCGYCDEQFGPPLSFQQRKEFEEKHDGSEGYRSVLVDSDSRVSDGKMNESELGKSLKFFGEENGRSGQWKQKEPSSPSQQREAFPFQGCRSSPISIVESKSALDEGTVLVAAKRAILSKMFSCSEVRSGFVRDDGVEFEQALISCGDVNESQALMSLLSESLQALQVRGKPSWLRDCKQPEWLILEPRREEMIC
eukprot:752780-Hanusia_phi.AAC.3